MATQNSINLEVTNNSDGYEISGGSTKRKLTVTGADITMTGSGTNTYTFPSSSQTLVGRTSTDTLTNKTLTSPTLITPVLGTPSSGTLTNCSGLPETGITFTDVTTNNASTSKHGFLMKLDGTTTNFLRGDGTWAPVPGSGDVSGPASSTDDDIAVFDGTTGKLIKDGGKTVAQVLNRANHTGTQTYSTISDFQTGVEAYSINNVVEDTTPQLGGNLDINAKGFTEELTAGEAVSSGDLCYLKSDGKMWKADASAESTSSTLLAIATESISADATGTFLMEGSYTSSSLTAGSKYYISETAGAITTTAPSTSGSIVRIIGYAISTTRLYFKPDGSYVENS